MGTSGWSYQHWAGDFYPERHPAGQRLTYCTTEFPSVEVNATFYRLPAGHMVLRWRDAAPAGFAFAVKGSRLITHFRRLEEVAPALAAFSERLRRRLIDNVDLVEITAFSDEDAYTLLDLGGVGLVLVVLDVGEQVALEHVRR